MSGRFSVEAIFKAVDTMSAPINKIEAKLLGLTKNTRKGLAEIGQVNASIHAGLMKVAFAAGIAGTAVGAVGLNVAKAGMDFEQQIADVGAVSLKSRGEIQDLEVRARELGRTTKFSATEVASGMELMAKAGFENKDILSGIGGMLAAAAAEGTEFAETAGHVSNVLKGMGIETQYAGAVADVLALASVRTNSSISSLGESMANVSATAREFRVPLEDVVAGVALLQDVGLDASVAGSAMNTMLINLSKPTDKVKEQMHKLGISFQDAHGNMLPLPGVLGQMDKAAKKSGGNMKVAAFFADLVGMRGQKAASNLAKMFREGKFQKLADELENAAGSAEKMATLRMDTLRGDVEQLGGAVDEMKIGLFDMNSGPLRGVVQGMTKWVEANRGLILSKTQEWIDKLVKNLPEIVKWVKRIGITIAVFYTFATAVKVAQTAVIAYETAVKLATMSTKAWRLASLGVNAVLGRNAAALALQTAQLDLFATQGIKAQHGLAGMRGALNASALGSQINGITSKLGQAGLLGAALAVGLAFGTWLNDTFELDKKISGMVEKLTGLDKTLNVKRNKERGVGKNSEQEFADGTVLSAKGEVLKYGKDADHHIANLERDSFRREEEGFGNMRMNPMMRKGLAAMRAKHGDPATAPQVIGPDERVAKSISETTNTTKAEVTIKDETGKAAVTKKPVRGNVSLRLKPSGAF